MGAFCDGLKLGSTVAPDCRTGQNKGKFHKKELSFLLVFGGLAIDIYYKKQGSLFRKYFPLPLVLCQYQLLSFQLKNQEIWFFNSKSSSYLAITALQNTKKFSFIINRILFVNNIFQVSKSFMKSLCRKNMHYIFHYKRTPKCPLNLITFMKKSTYYH